jgi:nitrile hydratase beta subunit
VVCQRFERGTRSGEVQVGFPRVGTIGLMDGVHDMGGMHGFGAVVTDDGADTHHNAWEVRAQVITLLAGRSMRDAIERLDPATYLASSYYERWLRAGEAKLVEQGSITPDDLTRWRDLFEHDTRARPPVTSNPEMVALIGAMQPAHFEPAPDAKFTVGDLVTVRRMWPVAHHRCPRYVRGATGAIERVLGADVVPGAPSGERSVEPVYTVEFDSVDLFGDREASGVDRSHTILIDLVERYIEPAR